MGRCSRGVPPPVPFLREGGRLHQGERLVPIPSSRCGHEAVYLSGVGDGPSGDIAMFLRLVTLHSAHKQDVSHISGMVGIDAR